MLDILKKTARKMGRSKLALIEKAVPAEADPWPCKDRAGRNVYLDDIVRYRDGRDHFVVVALSHKGKAVIRRFADGDRRGRWVNLSDCKLVSRSFNLAGWAR